MVEILWPLLIHQDIWLLGGGAGCGWRRGFLTCLSFAFCAFVYGKSSSLALRSAAFIKCVERVF